MEPINLSWQENKAKRNNNKLLPGSIRGIIVGKSGCGKTTLLLNLLLQPDWLDYNKLCVFGKSLFQPEYRLIKKAFEAQLHKENILKLIMSNQEINESNYTVDEIIHAVSKENSKPSEITCCFYENSKDVPDPRELNPREKNLMVFDDLMLEKQNTCESYYIRGRHSNVDCFYLSQNYFKLPRQTIRENANFIILFPQDLKNINHIYNDHVSIDMDKEEFRRLCKKCWEKPFSFLVIDLTSDKQGGKYRMGLDKFYFPL